MKIIKLPKEIAIIIKNDDRFIPYTMPSYPVLPENLEKGEIGIISGYRIVVL